MPDKITQPPIIVSGPTRPDTMPMAQPDAGPAPFPKSSDDKPALPEKRKLTPEQVKKILENMTSYDDASKTLNKIIGEEWPEEMKGVSSVIEKIQEAQKDDPEKFMGKMKSILKDYGEQLQTNTKIGAWGAAILLTAATLGTMSWASSALAAGTLTYAEYFVLANVLMPIGVGASNTFLFRPPKDRTTEAYIHDMTFSLAFHGVLKGLFSAGQAGFAYLAGVSAEAPVAFKGLGEFAWKNNHLVFKPSTWSGAALKMTFNNVLEPGLTGAGALTLFTISDHTFLKHDKPLTSGELWDAAFLGMQFGIGLNAFGKGQLKIMERYAPKSNVIEFGKFSKEYNEEMSKLLKEMKIDTSKMTEGEVARRAYEEFGKLANAPELNPQQEALLQKFTDVVAGFKGAMDLSVPANREHFLEMCKALDIDPKRMETLKFQDFLALVDKKYNAITAKYMETPKTKLDPMDAAKMRYEQFALINFMRQFVMEQIRAGNYEFIINGNEFHLGDKQAPKKSISPDQLEIGYRNPNPDGSQLIPLGRISEVA